MKNNTIVALLLLIVFGACKKDQENTQILQPNAAKRLVGFQYEGDKYAPLTIEYDGKSRVIRMDGGEDVSIVTYSGNQVHIKETRKAENREVYNFTGKLNAQGNVVEGEAISNYSEAIVNQVKYKFEYNAEGYMTRKIQDFNAGDRVYDTQYTYENGNLTHYKTYVNGVYDYGGTWEYDHTKKDKSGLTWEHFGVANTFTGKANQNLAIKYTGLRPDGSSWYSVSTYTMDNEGYPVSCAVSISNGNQYKLLYQYQ